ncbi:copper amine oxidase N-terminal domain-containing protein [Alkalihalophilus marmarensis]|nr:copper amine oxidase N-terminal domain-containing protein [Alkalihalophilus marmarensis]
MWRIGIMTVCTIFLCIFITSTAEAAKFERMNVFLEEKQVYFSHGVYVEQNRTLVEFRAIFEALGLQVSYDANTKTVKGSKPGLTIELKLNSKRAVVNGKVHTLDVAVKAINGRTFVPLRFVSEASGIQVIWKNNPNFKEIYLLDPSVPKKNVQMTFGSTQAQFTLPVDVESQIISRSGVERSGNYTAYVTDFYYPDSVYFKDNVWLLAVYKMPKRDWDQYWSHGMWRQIGTASDGWVYAINTPGEDPYMMRYPKGSEKEYMKVHHHLKNSIIATLR